MWLKGMTLILWSVMRADADNANVQSCLLKLHEQSNEADEVFESIHFQDCSLTKETGFAYGTNDEGELVFAFWKVNFESRERFLGEIVETYLDDSMARVTELPEMDQWRKLRARIKGAVLEAKNKNMRAFQMIRENHQVILGDVRDLPVLEIPQILRFASVKPQNLVSSLQGERKN